MEPDKAARAVAAVRGAIATNDTSEPRSRSPLVNGGLSGWVASLERGQVICSYLSEALSLLTK